MHPRYSLHPLLSLSLIIAAPPISAQVTLNNGDLTPLPGESFPHGLIPWTAQGAGGTGQTWDFSTIAPGSSLAFNWIAPTSGQLAQYPTCAVVKTTPGYFEFYEMATNVLSELGNYYGLTLTDIHYDDPRDEMRYPFSLGSSYVDDFSGLRIHSIGGINDTTVLTGTFEVTADGEGTLVLPWATYTDVLRLHVERNDIEDATDTTHTDEYRFVKTGLHTPLLRLYARSYSWQSAVLQVGRVLMPDPTGVHEQKGAGNSIVYADQQLHITCPTLGGTISVELLAADSRIVRTWVIGTMTHASPLTLSVPPTCHGIHLVRVIFGDGRSFTKRVFIGQ